MVRMLVEHFVCALAAHGMGHLLHIPFVVLLRLELFGLLVEASLMMRSLRMAHKAVLGTHLATGRLLYEHWLDSAGIKRLRLDRARHILLTVNHLVVMRLLLVIVVLASVAKLRRDLLI